MSKSRGIGRGTYLPEKIPVECAEDGCHEIIFVNRGNAAKNPRCEEHRRIRYNKIVREARQARREPSNYDPELDNRLAQLRSFRTFVKCRNEFCATLVEVDGLTARHRKGVYCEPCRREAKRISDRTYDRSRRKFLRQQRQRTSIMAA